MAQDLAHDATHDDHDDHKPRRPASSAGCSPPITRTSARCTWCSACIMFFIGGAMAMVIRAELFKPGLQFVDPELFNSDDHHARAGHDLRRGHAGVRRARQLDGADADRRARHGAAAHEQLQLLDPAVRLHAAAVARSSCRAARPAGGWTMYPPLVLQSGDSLPMLIFAIHLMGASSIMGAINIVVTIMNMRAPGMNAAARCRCSCWSWLITAYLLIAVMPVLAGAVTMLLTDHFFGTSFFNAGRRRRPGDVRAHLLVLRPSRGLHHDPAGLRHHLGDHADLLAQAAVRRDVDGLRDRLHRVPVVHRVGATTCSWTACRWRRSCSS